MWKRFSTHIISQCDLFGDAGPRHLKLGAADGSWAIQPHGHGWGSWVFEFNATESNGTYMYTTLHYGRGGFQAARGQTLQHPNNVGGPLYVSHRDEYIDATFVNE